MKTSYKIELDVPAQWKAPWRRPKVNAILNSKELPLVVNGFKNKLGRVVKGVHNFLIKNMVHDR